MRNSMKKIAFLYYRSWSYEILKYIYQVQINRKDFIISDVICPEGTSDDFSFLNKKTSIHFIDPKESNNLKNILEGSDIELIFCYSWSWLIADEIVENYHCICLHPSMLPQYRGGSPIQNQVFDGVLDSAVSVFKMDSGIDSGPIYKQQEFSLDAPIEDIFRKMSEIGKIISKELISDYLNKNLIFHEQNHHNATIVKRRKPSDSCISLEDIASLSFANFQRKVNVLRNPYPNINIKFNEFLLEISKINFYESLLNKNFLINRNTPLNSFQGNEIYVETLDGFALISEYVIQKK